MGTYLGECNDTEDQRYVELLAAGINSGLNLVDTAINYRCQRSERAVGRALRKALNSGFASRSDIVVCTKGGYIPLEGEPPASRDEYKAYLTSEYFDHGIMSTADVVAGGHCFTPRFLSDQIERSSANLGLDCIDVFYIHNPEQQLDILSRSAFLDAMREAFAELETNVTSGKIGVYGCATWNGFRVFPANRNYLSLAELLSAAVDAGGRDHHFRVVQLPVNLAMTEGVRSPTQHDGSTNLPLLEMATAVRRFGHRKRCVDAVAADARPATCGEEPVSWPRDPTPSEPSRSHARYPLHLLLSVCEPSRRIWTKTLAQPASAPFQPRYSILRSTTLPVSICIAAIRWAFVSATYACFGPQQTPPGS